LEIGVGCPFASLSLVRYSVSSATPVSLVPLRRIPGGLGINLATADTVIHYDSDHNPQADLQVRWLLVFLRLRHLLLTFGVRFDDVEHLGGFGVASCHFAAGCDACCSL
jgi:hypothetical protein